MLGMSSLVNNSVPCHLFGAGKEFPVCAVEGAIRFSLEDLVMAWVAAGCELARVEGSLALGGAHDILLS